MGGTITDVAMAFGISVVYLNFVSYKIFLHLQPLQLRDRIYNVYSTFKPDGHQGTIPGGLMYRDMLHKIQIQPNRAAFLELCKTWVGQP